MCHGRFWQHITGNHLSANRERSLAVVASLRFWHLDLSYDCGITIVSLHRAWLDWPSIHGSSYVRSEAKQSYVTAVLYILPWSTCTLTPVVVEALQVPTSSSQCDLCLVHSLNTKCGRKCQRWRLPAALPGLLAQGGVPHGPGGL